MPSLHVGPDQFHLKWDRSIPPLATVASGAVIEIDAMDASGGQLTERSVTADLASLDFERVDQAHGPIFVESAEPGDALEIELLDFRPGSWGWTAIAPGFGLLAADFPEPALRITSIGSDVAGFLSGVRVPVVPFCGVLGVAPADEGPLSTIPPGPFGGNMDTRHLTAGSKLFLPVFAPGALFSLGDGHAAQGDGEVCGTAIETSMRALVRLTVRKDLHLTGPEFETAGPMGGPARSGGSHATDGVGPDLMGAAQDAVRRMIDYLGRAHGIGPVDAYMLCSVAVDLRISEIVDAPNWIVTAHCPLSIFE